MCVAGFGCAGGATGAPGTQLWTPLQGLAQHSVSLGVGVFGSGADPVALRNCNLPKTFHI